MLGISCPVCYAEEVAMISSCSMMLIAIEAAVIARNGVRRNRRLSSFEGESSNLRVTAARNSPRSGWRSTSDVATNAFSGG